MVIGEGKLENIIDVPNISNEADIIDSVFDLHTISQISSVSSVISDISEKSINFQTFLETYEFIAAVYDITSEDIFFEELDDYLCGVVFSEMPSSFEIEALKAQAVAARSYYIYKVIYSGGEEREYHRGADICTDPSHCKAYISFNEACDKWGEEYILPLWEKVKKSVTDTAGEIIVYESEPVIAVFHAMSTETTESAENIWGRNVPYLTSVPTLESENAETIKNFAVVSSYSSADFKSALISNVFKIDFNENPELWIGETALNSSGRIDTIRIGGRDISGKRLREIFSLRSTDFSLEYKAADDIFIFSVRGHGHGVGMSQYGANLMARQGKNYKDILLWYYSGVEFDNLQRKTYK